MRNWLALYAFKTEHSTGWNVGAWIVWVLPACSNFEFRTEHIPQTLREGRFISKSDRHISAKRTLSRANSSGTNDKYMPQSDLCQYIVVAGIVGSQRQYFAMILALLVVISSTMIISMTPPPPTTTTTKPAPAPAAAAAAVVIS